MFWYVLISIFIIYSLIHFFISYSKDKEDLHGQTLNQKFEIIVNTINNEAFNGNGTITTLDKREFNLYEEGKNQIVNFQYSTGHLTIIWKYKYFQKEIIHKRQFDNVRNLSIFKKENIGRGMIKEMDEVVKRHKNAVLAESEYGSKTHKVTVGPKKTWHNIDKEKIESLMKKMEEYTTRGDDDQEEDAIDDEWILSSDENEERDKEYEIESLKLIIIEKMYNLAIEALENSPMKETPLASYSIIESLNSSSDSFEKSLILEKNKLELEEEEISDLIKDAYKAVYEKLLD